MCLLYYYLYKYKKNRILNNSNKTKLLCLPIVNQLDNKTLNILALITLSSAQVITDTV